MPEINMEGFENISTSGFKMLDPGEYTARITEPPAQGFDNDKNYIEVHMEAVQGPPQKEVVNAETGSKDPAGVPFRDRIYLTAAAAWRLKRLLVCAGLLARDDKASPMAKGKIQTDLLAGATVHVRMTPNIRDGKEYRNVEYII
jgi:hypothetical protein